MINKYGSLLLFFLGFTLTTLVCKAQTQFNSVYKIVNRATGYVLEIPANPNQDALERSGTLCTQRAYLGTANQQWYLQNESNGTYRIVNRNSSQLLNVEAANGANGGELLDNALVVQRPAYGIASEQWEISSHITSTSMSYSFYGITNHNSGRQLVPSSPNENDAITQRADPNFDDYAQWDIVSVATTSSYGTFSGVSTITNYNSQKVLQIVSQSGSPGANAEQGDYINIASQQWQLVGNSLGSYAIVNRLSGLVLQVVGQSTTAGARIEQGQNVGILSQQWIITNASNFGANYYTITNRNSNLVLQVVGKSTSAGAPVEQGSSVPIGSQVWRIDFISQNRGPLATSTANTGQAKLVSYPNPASDYITLEVAGIPMLQQVTVTDVRGALVNLVAYRGNGHLDITNLVPGLYVISVSDGRQVYHQKFIKE